MTVRATPIRERGARYSLGALLAFGALNAFGGGIYGMSGARSVPREWLAGSPFNDYFIPSLLLFTTLGGAFLLSAIAVFKRSRHARWLAAGAGAIALAWIAAQVWIIGFVSWLQPTVAVAGLLILALASQLPRRVAGSLPIREAAARFLAQKRIAVTGVSRTPQTHGSNVVYRRLRERGYQVFAVNPNALEVEGDRAFPSLRSIAGGVDAVVIATKPETSEATMRECVELGINRAWMHRAFGEGSVSKSAAEYGRAHGIEVIEGGCPCMFAPASDPGHKVLRFCLTLTGKVPRHVCAHAPVGTEGRA